MIGVKKWIQSDRALRKEESKQRTWFAFARSSVCFRLFCSVSLICAGDGVLTMV
jgi:hypothetical protein